jgi:hypothetical protein
MLIEVHRTGTTSHKWRTSLLKQRARKLLRTLRCKPPNPSNVLPRKSSHRSPSGRTSFSPPSATLRAAASSTSSTTAVSPHFPLSGSTTSTGPIHLRVSTGSLAVQSSRRHRKERSKFWDGGRFREDEGFGGDEESLSGRPPLEKRSPLSADREGGRGSVDDDLAEGLRGG